MEEIEKFRELLSLLDHLDCSEGNVDAAELVQCAGDDEDAEAAHWASLVLGANGRQLREARIRTCRSGLAAVSRFITDRNMA